MIKNADALVRGDRRRADALAIVEAGIEAVLPENVLKASVRLEGDTLDIKGTRYDLTKYRHIFVAGGGKASAAMAAELEKVLDGRITAGVVNDRYGAEAHTEIVKVNHAGHPLPTRDGVRGVEEMLRLLARALPEDLVIFLISGGGSALLPYPAAGVTLEDKIALTNQLLKSGARIEEMNAVRKHVSGIKGGQLLRYVDGAAVACLIVSDVVGDDAGFIASGPTAPDRTTFSDAREILRKYGIYEKAPASVVRHIEAGDRGEIPETPKPGDPVFGRITNVIVAGGAIALDAAATKARELHYEPLNLGPYIVGESREVGLVLAGIARGCAGSGMPVRPPAAIISGGETTVTIRGKGRGGRNQELVAGALQDLPAGAVVISVDTDGIDGSTDACGAIADSSTPERAEKTGLSLADALRENASYDFFNGLGDLVFTGPTGTNVSDLRLVLLPR